MSYIIEFYAFIALVIAVASSQLYRFAYPGAEKVSYCGLIYPHDVFSIRR